jgi:hypothetical protein
MLVSYVLLFIVCLASELVYCQKRLGAQACTDIFEGTGCKSPGEMLCCEEDMVNVISCEKKTKEIKYYHCTGTRICAADGKGSVACFEPGTQPTPP